MYLILSILLGFLIMHLLTASGSPIWLRFPKVKVTRIQLFPSVRIFVRGRIIHFHHWLNFSVLLVISVFFIQGGILMLLISKGFLLGGIVQGFFFCGNNNRKIIYRIQEDRNQQKRK